MDIFDRIASQFQKEARIPSVGNPKYEPCPCKNPKAKGPCKCPTGETWTKEEVKAYYDDFKGSLGKEWAKYEGAFDPSSGKMSQDRIKKNMRGKGKKASFYGDEIIDDLGLDRVDLGGFFSRRASSSFRSSTPFEIVTDWFANAEEDSDFELEYTMGVDGDDEISGDVEIHSGHPVSSILSDLKRDLGGKHNLEFKKVGPSTIRWGLPEQSGDFEGEHFRFASDGIIDDLGLEGEHFRFASDEIIDDLGLERTASDREAELLAEDLMVLAEELMSGKRRGPLKSSVRRAIGKALKKSLGRGNNLKNRTKKTMKTLREPRTQESRARARVRKQRRYDRYSR
tara:strand:- start:3002 stop:4021 length:1020 start_codon:yes stop_codon:yes gene_type:complete